MERARNKVLMVVVCVSICTAFATQEVRASGFLWFDGTEDYVNLDAHVGDYAGLSNGTICAWIRSEETGALDDVFFAASDGSTDAPMYFEKYRDGRIKIRIAPGGISRLRWFSTNTLPEGWHHFAYATDGSGNSMYLDGQQIFGTYEAGNSSTNAFFSHMTVWTV